VRREVICVFETDARLASHFEQGADPSRSVRAENVIDVDSYYLFREVVMYDAGNLYSISLLRISFKYCVSRVPQLRNVYSRLANIISDCVSS
jgi:hypothetical protein